MRLPATGQRHQRAGPSVTPRNLPDDVRTRTLAAVRNGAGKVEVRTRVESNETELVLVSADRSRPLGSGRNGVIA
jgi:hypothetical protein